MSQQLNRATRILKFVGNTPDAGVSTIARQLREPKASVHRITRSLLHEGLLRQSSAGKFSLGYLLVALGECAGAQTALRDVALPYMTKLRDDVNETTHLAVMVNKRPVYIAKVECFQVIRHWTRLGEPLELHCGASSKCLAAYTLSKHEVLDSACHNSGYFQKYTENTLTSPEALFYDFELARKRHYSISIEERYNGVLGIAVPLFDFTNRVVGSVSVAGPVERFGEQRQSELLASLQNVGTQISRKLGSSLPNINDVGNDCGTATP